MKKWILLPLMIALVLLAAGCAGASTPEATPTVAASDTPAAPAATETLPPATPTETIEPSPTTPMVIEPPSIEESGVLDTSQFAVAAPGTVADLVAWEVVPGTPYDPNTPVGILGVPPHLLVTFDDDVVDTVYFRPDQRQGRVIPVDDYENMFSSSEVTLIPDEIQRLQELLSQTDPDLNGPLPMLPPVNAAQILTARGHIVEFDGGQGIAYLASFSQGILPITSQNLLYIFQGLSADGSQLVSFVYPVASTLLPVNMDSVPQEIDDALAADPQQYYANTAELLDSGIPADFSPNLDQLDSMFSSIQINTAPGAAVTPQPTNTLAPSATPTRGVTIVPATPTATPVYANSDLLGSWFWIRLEPGGGSAVSPQDPDEYIVTFNANGALAVRADCNTASGSFRIGTRDRLFIDLTGGTTKDCGEGSLWETFFDYLEEAASYSIDGNRLTINLQGGGEMRFDR